MGAIPPTVITHSFLDTQPPLLDLKKAWYCFAHSQPIDARTQHTWNTSKVFTKWWETNLDNCRDRICGTRLCFLISWSRRLHFSFFFFYFLLAFALTYFECSLSPFLSLVVLTPRSPWLERRLLDPGTVRIELQWPAWSFNDVWTSRIVRPLHKHRAQSMLNVSNRLPGKLSLFFSLFSLFLSLSFLLFLYLWCCEMEENWDELGTIGARRCTAVLNDIVQYTYCCVYHTYFALFAFLSTFCFFQFLSLSALSPSLLCFIFLFSFLFFPLSCILISLTNTNHACCLRRARAGRFSPNRCQTEGSSALS